MRAWRVHELGHPSVSLRLDDVELPAPAAGQVAVRVEASVVNFADILLCQGIYQDRPGVPLTPGLETVGVVEAVGPGVDLAVGTRVAGMAALPSGGFADRALVKAKGVVAMDPDIPAPHAAALFSTYLTSHVALHHRAHLQPGETLLVHAAAGGVGSSAVQIGLAAGATVIATVGSADKVEFVRDLGAHHVIDAGSTDVVAAVKAITGGRGVDVAYDPVGGELGDLTRRMMAWEGRLLVIGFASGTIPSHPANHVLVKSYSVVGVHLGAYVDQPNGRAVIEAAHADMQRIYRAGQATPRISRTVPLEGLPSAFDDLEHRRVLGRVVLVP